MTRTILWALCLTVAFASLRLPADSDPPDPDLDEGKALVKARGCTRCHGLSGNTGYETAPPTPKLAGQPISYLVKSMQDYRSGARQSETMNAIMRNRTDDEIELMAHYYAAQKRY